MKRLLAVFLCVVIFLPLTGSIYDQPVYNRVNWSSIDDSGIHWMNIEDTYQIPLQAEPSWAEEHPEWYERSIFDQNKNAIHDSIENSQTPVGMGISYNTEVSDTHIAQLEQLGIEVVDVIEAINSVLIGVQEVSLAQTLADLPNVLMVHQYGTVVFYGDIQTPNVNARNSSIYPDAAWNFGVTGKGVNIAMVDTGVDNEHPGLVGKFVAGYDAVCYLHTDQTCVAAGLGARETDGSYDQMTATNMAQLV